MPGVTSVQKENYECPNCKAVPVNESIGQVQDLYSPCEECTSIHNAKKFRTAYDRFWLQYYNNKAQNAPTDLMDLQFAP